MSDDVRLLELAQKLDPDSDDVIAISGKGRGRAMDVAVAALICAGAASPEERAVRAAEMRAAAVTFRDISAQAREMATDILGDRAMPDRLKVRAFVARAMALPEDGAIDRETAISVAEEARDVVLPAINRIISVIQQVEIEALDAHMAEMSRRTALTGRMITEMDRIGKTIGLISINASVEAARAGGESGRAFQVIAQEVRSLATQSADRLARLKREMVAEGGGAARPDPAAAPAGRAPGGVARPAMAPCASGAPPG